MCRRAVPRRSLSDAIYDYCDGIAQVRRAAPDQLFRLVIEASPEPGTDEYDEVGGAFVVCLVDADDLRSAEQRAVAVIRERQWRPDRFEEWTLVTAATFADDPAAQDPCEPDMRELVEQAFLDGVVAIYNAWPPDSPDADED